ncbi:hypothetical protein ASG82_11510 [Mycobacterium sp. Soil538]|nr:hypothetical protein ASG82_11510 [Mycobacterium sp. Soil538]
MTTTQLAGRHRLARRPDHAGPRWGMASMIAAAASAGWLLAVVDDDGLRTATVETQPAAESLTAQDIQRAGQVTAVSANSLTTTAVDGQVTTFRITPDTAAITQPGTSAPFAVTSFAPAQHVVVVGVIHDGVPVATAIADPAAAGPAGPPMDYQLPT